VSTAIYELSYAMYKARKPMEANKVYVQDYLKDNKNAVIGTHHDRNLGSVINVYSITV